MKLLFDQNLSPRLVKLLLDLFPNSAHVNDLGLGTALDRAVWDYALINNMLIVTKDSDFNDLGLILGFPPKLIWIKRGNCSTKEIGTLIRTNFPSIQSFEADPNAGILTLL